MRSWRISRFQLSAIVVVTVLTVVGLVGLRDLRERLECAQVRATVRNLNSALQVEIAHRIDAGREASIAALAGANPVPWLATALPGYIGETATPPARPAPGSWYFDRTSGELAYRPVLSSHLTSAGSPPLLKWRIERSRHPPRLLLTGGLALVAVVDYRWY
jgi:hypothetical protein